MTRGSVVDRLRRWRRWLIALGVLILVRALLPLVLQKVIASQASDALNARVEVGDVDLALLQGGVALKDVVVRAAGAAPDSPPLVAWKRFAIDLRWLSLFRKTIRLSEVVLDSPHVALERLRGGELNLLALVPQGRGEPGGAPSPGPPPAAVSSKPGWAFGIDRITLHTGNLRFQDFMFADSEPIVVELPAIEVTDIAVRPGLYGEPAQAHVELKLDEGTLRIDARITMRADGIGAETDIKADRLPLRHSRVYIPNVGWSDLRGELSADVQHRIDTAGTRHDLRGTVVLQDLTVRVPGLEEPALAWKHLTVQLDSVDLVARRAAVAKVDLNGLTVLVRTQGGDVLPLLRPAAAGNTSDAAAPPPAPPPDTTTSTQPPATPWRWSLAAAQVSESTVRVLYDAGRLDVGVAAEVHDLAGAGDQPAAVRLSLMVGDGSLGVDGKLRLVPIGFAGHVTIDKLNLPDVVLASGVVPPDLVKSAQLAGALDVEAGSAAPTPGDVNVRGKISLADTQITAKEFSFGAQSIEVGLEEIIVPNPKNPTVPALPLRVRLGDIRIAAPNAQVTRTADGIVLPQLAAASASTPQPAPSVAAAAAPRVEVSIASFQLTKGRIAFSDRAVKPYYSGVITSLDINLREVRFPEIAAKQVRLDATAAPHGTIKATGSMGPKGGTVDLKVNEVSLAPFNPYAVAYSPYSITRGGLSVDARASFAKNAYKADSSITLHDLDVGGAEGDSLFQQQFGIPLTVALALLKDMSGNITMDIPIEADQAGMKVGIGTIVAGALRSALMGVLTSPLKLIGAVVQGGRVQGGAPPQIAFRLGRAEPTAESAEQIKQLAAFVASRPGIGVTLEPVPSPRDARWLREQALAAELGKPQGVFGAVRNIGKGGIRERIGKALAARATDETGELDADDSKALEQWLDERPAPSADQLEALADARLAKIESVLRDEHGVAASRITRGAAIAEPTDAPPAVRLQIGPVKKAE